jgi:hypothetical protein
LLAKEKVEELGLLWEMKCKRTLHLHPGLLKICGEMSDGGLKRKPF